MELVIYYQTEYAKFLYSCHSTKNGKNYFALRACVLPQFLQSQRLKCQPAIAVMIVSQYPKIGKDTENYVLQSTVGRKGKLTIEAKNIVAETVVAPSPPEATYKQIRDSLTTLNDTRTNCCTCTYNKQLFVEETCSTRDWQAVQEAK